MKLHALFVLTILLSSCESCEKKHSKVSKIIGCDATGGCSTFLDNGDHAAVYWPFIGKDVNYMKCSWEDE